MDLRDLFSPGGLLVPAADAPSPLRRPRAAFVLNGREDLSTGLAMVELAARIGYECEAGDPERLVVLPGTRPDDDAVAVALEVQPDLAPGSGRLEVVEGLAGCTYGLRLGAADSRHLWKLAAWLAAVGADRTLPGPHPGNSDLSGRSLGTSQGSDPAGWRSKIIYDDHVDHPGAATIRLETVAAEPWSPAVHVPAEDPALGHPSEHEMGLDRLWSPGGLLATSDGLQPDQAAVVIQPAPGQDRWSPDELAGLIMFAFRLGLEATGLTFPITMQAHRRRHAHIRLTQPNGERPGEGTIRCLRGDPSAGVGVVLTVSGDATGRARALRWLATAHATERLRPLNARRPALDTVAVALERERWAQVHKTVRGEPAVWTREFTVIPVVERFRQAWRERALAAVRAHCRPEDAVRVDIRLDQPDEILRAVEDEVRASLLQMGFSAERLHVQTLPAFRQGLYWLLSTLPSAVRRHPGVNHVVIEFALPEAALDPAADGDAGPMLDLPIRWLQPLYPVDELLSARIGIPTGNITFRRMPSNPSGATYRAILLDTEGREVWSDTFHVAAVRRPYQFSHPELGSVYVETGLCRVEKLSDAGHAAQEVFREFVASAGEAVWTRYQEEVLPQVRQVLDRILGDDLRPDCQPFFLTLDIEVDLDTRPDERLGIREERYSTAEGLHEDLYFNTLEFFSRWGQHTAGTAFDSPGKVVPRVRVRPGRETRMSVRLQGVGVDRRLAQMIHSDQGADRTVEVTVGAEGSARAKLHRPDGTIVEVDYEEGMRRALRAVGLDAAGPGRPSSDPSAVNSAAEELAWPRTVFDNVSLYAGLAHLAREHPVRWTIAGHSFEGRPVYQVLALPVGGCTAPLGPDAIVVPAKCTLFRPTVLFKARHHANEVSSTNALLALLQEHSDSLEGINCVIMPLENVDGAALHKELSGDDLCWSLHSARYNALGQEYATAYFDPAPLAPETAAFPMLWSHWLPDVVVDEHGVPSHEWAQPFGAHGGGGRQFASYWLPRALIYGIIPAFDASVMPRHAYWQRDFVRFVAQVLKDDPIVHDANRRWLEIYRKYAVQWLPEVFDVEMVGDFVCYTWLLPPDPDGRYPMQRHPNVTGIEFITEAADETARGSYLETCARTHLAVDLAVLAWVRRLPNPVVEAVQFDDGSVSRRRTRIRPWMTDTFG